MLGLFFPYGFLLQGLALPALRAPPPETYWLFIILMGGALGAFIYILVEVIPDAGLLRGAFQVFPRRKRIKELEAAVLDNPLVGITRSLATFTSRTSSTPALASPSTG